jgi:hypothetical protein
MKLVDTLKELSTPNALCRSGIIYGAYLVSDRKSLRDNPLSTTLVMGFTGLIYGIGAEFIGSLLNPYGALIPIAIGYSIMSSLIWPVKSQFTIGTNTLEPLPLDTL